MARIHRIPPTKSTSERMKKVRRRDTDAEREVARVLRRLRLGRRSQVRRLPGSPDFVLRDHPVVIFVDGCFWHGCPRCYVAPKRNAAWWAEKIAKNVARDRRNDRKLRSLGFSVVHVWEHDDPMRVERRIATTVRRVRARRP